MSREAAFLYGPGHADLRSILIPRLIAGCHSDARSAQLLLSAVPDDEV